jgi:general secretion pathway protein H
MSPADLRRVEPHWRERGFTLLEVMIVLTILGLVVAMTLPLIGRRGSGANLVAAASELRAVIHGARTAAIAGGQPVIFRGDPSSGYWLGGSHYRLTSVDAANPVRVATAGGSRIAFFPSGGSSGGRVIVRSAATRREIAVDPVTGRAALLP